jgi:hypothetical protein
VVASTAGLEQAGIRLLVAIAGTGRRGEALTPREVEVLALIAAGASNTHSPANWISSARIEAGAEAGVRPPSRIRNR